MKNAGNSDDYGKKFQLTDSLLKRVLSREDYDRIKTIEPVFVYTDELNCKPLKNPGYKHAAVSSNFLYIVNTPAKNDSDMLFVVSLENVENIEIIFDTADFLQGNLRKTSQHIKLRCKQQLLNTEHLLFKAASLALAPSASRETLRTDGTLKPTKLTTSKSSSNLSLDNENYGGPVSPRICKSLNTSPTSSFSNTDLNSRLDSDFKDSNDDISKQKSARRPLPKPMFGTEMLNASFTSTELHGLKSSKKQKASEMSPSRSLESLDIQSALLKRKPLTKSQKDYFLSSSLNQSWNDILRNEQGSTTSTKLKNPNLDTLRRSDLNESSIHGDTKKSLNQSQQSLNGSLSSKIFKSMKGQNTKPRNPNLDSLRMSEPAKSSSNESLKSKKDSQLQSSLSSRLFKSSKAGSMPTIHKHPTDQPKKTTGSNYNIPHSYSEGPSNVEKPRPSLSHYEVHVFTVAPGSKMFNVIEQAWIYSIITKTCNMKDTSIGILSASQLSQHRKHETDQLTQKFTELKREILNTASYDELFLLTKELKFAADKYSVIRRSTWKSPALLGFYVNKMRILVESKCTSVTERMDELDAAILFGEFLVSIFQDSEMFNGRNMILNENSASFVKELLNVILTVPKMKCFSRDKESSTNDELLDLITNWTETSISILFEVITATKQNVWCCSLGMKSLDVNLLSRFLIDEERHLKTLMDHLVLKLTSSLTEEWEIPPSPFSIVVLYKSLVVLHYVCTHCPCIMDYVKTYYHEEVKYYISKEDNVKRIPSNYPVTCLIKSYLPKVIEAIT
eukprot:TCONS_00018617-protein